MPMVDKLREASMKRYQQDQQKAQEYRQQQQQMQQREQQRRQQMQQAQQMQQQKSRALLDRIRQAAPQTPRAPAGTGGGLPLPKIRDLTTRQQMQKLQADQQRANIPSSGFSPQMAQHMGIAPSKPNITLPPGGIEYPEQMELLNRVGAPAPFKKGGKVKKAESAKKYASGGSVGSTSRRADGIAQRGKTKCKMV